MSRKTENEAWHAGFTEACRQWTLQSESMKHGVDPHPITREVPEQYQWNQDYNETLISAAGGDGETRTVIMYVIDHADASEVPVQFTNVPMHHVHAAIALLNGDQDTTPEGVGKWRTKDFTMLELFPDAGKFIPQEYCEECGAFIPIERARVKHVAWHNKTLP